MLKKYVVVLATVTIAVLLAGMIYASYAFRNRGRILAVNLEVYADTGLTTPLTDIDWGMLHPGESKNVTGYVLNTGNAPVVLSCYSQNWVPEAAATYITLDAYFHDGYLVPGESTPLTLQLTVNASITDIDTFEFLIIVVGSMDEVPPLGHYYEDAPYGGRYFDDRYFDDYDVELLD